jgi:hypothetical protein
LRLLKNRVMETIEVLQKELGVEGIQHLEDLHLLMKVQLAMMAYCKDHSLRLRSGTDPDKPKYNIVEDGPVQSNIIVKQKLVKPRKQRVSKGVVQPPATPPLVKKKRGGRMLGAKNKPKPETDTDTPQPPLLGGRKKEKGVKPWDDDVYHNSGSPGRPKKVKPIVEELPELEEDPKPKKDKVGYPPMVVTNPDKITMKDLEGKSDHTAGKIRFQVNPRTWIWIDPKLSKKEREALKEKYSLESVVIGATTNGLSDGKEFISTFNK